MNKKNLYVLIGNIAAGKSTWVKTNKMEPYTVSRDEVRYLFGDGDYVFNYKLEPCIDKMIKGLTEGQMIQGKDIVMDETQMSRDSRRWVLDLGLKYGYNIIGIVFKDRGMESHVNARLNDNHGDTTRETWEAVYTRKQAAYEPPDVTEGFSFIINL